MTPCEERGLSEGQWVWNSAETPWLSRGWVKLVNDRGDNLCFFWEPNSKYGDSWARKLQRLDFEWGVYDENPSWTPRNTEYDPVDRPKHYASGDIECIEAIQAALTEEEFRGYRKGSVIKYVWRERQKGGVESLRKARWHLDHLIAEQDE